MLVDLLKSALGLVYTESRRRISKVTMRQSLSRVLM